MENVNGAKQGKQINVGLITAVICLAVSSLLLYLVCTYPGLSRDYMLVSASFFPKVVSIVMLLCSIWLLIKAIVKPERRAPLDALEKQGYLRGILAILCAFGYSLAFKPLGYILSTIAALFLMMLIFGNRKWKQMIIVSLVFPTILYFAFKYGLQTPLPAGVLAFLGL